MPVEYRFRPAAAPKIGRPRRNRAKIKAARKAGRR
jgi:hypothetical protein